MRNPHQGVASPGQARVRCRSALSPTRTHQAALPHGTGAPGAGHGASSRRRSCLLYSTDLAKRSRCTDKQRSIRSQREVVAKWADVQAEVPIRSTEDDFFMQLWGDTAGISHLFPSHAAMRCESCREGTRATKPC